MNYEAILRDIPTNEIVDVTLDDGSNIKCKKIPLETLDYMDTFLTGMKNATNTASSALGFIATCGTTRLYSAVGDVSTYMKSHGRILSASIGPNGKITSQPGFVDTGLGKEGMQAASAAAKAIPWIGLAVMVVETGVKIVMKQQELKASQIAIYDKYLKDMEKHANNLWTVVNEYANAMKDEAVRTANYVIISNAFNDANNAFKDLVKDSSKAKRISDHLVYALKGALDLFSFAYLMKIMYINKAKIDTFPDYLDAARKDIESKTQTYNEILEKCYEQAVRNKEKHEKALRGTQYNNAAKDKKSILKRIGLDVVSGGVTELVSLGSKLAGKGVNKDDALLIENLEKCKAEENPYAECIEKVSLLTTQENTLFRDDEFLYYQTA